jgi:hypothetical protein
MEWFSKSMCFVDKVCCYSYSQEQIYSESDPMDLDMNSICMQPSWDMEDSSIVDDIPHQHPIWKSNDHAGRGKASSSNRYPQKGRSPARSVSTSTTVTTSTAPTVVTSCRTIQSGDNSITSQQQRWSDAASRPFHHDTFQSERRRATPNHIYCHSHSDGELYHGIEINSATSRSYSRSYSRVPFTAATEGFQC